MRLATLVTLAASLFAADKASVPTGSASNAAVRVEAVLHTTKQAVQQALGAELGDGIVLLEVKLTPAAGQKLAINRDDFLLRSDRDGQRATPYAPTQIAGGTTLVVRTTQGQGGGVMSDGRGPVWGGLGGGRPQRMGIDGSGIGNAGGTTEANAAIQSSGKDKEDPLLAVLEKKVLAERETSDPAAGQLYFLMEGKQKVKDLELLYKTSAGRLSIRFK